MDRKNILTKANQLKRKGKLDEAIALYQQIFAQKKEPILVLGMHNSGTSLLAEILHKNGLFMGVDMAHYESFFFSIFINNNLIMGGGSNWAQIPIMSVEKVIPI
jgi:hypothetical protein